MKTCSDNLSVLVIFVSYVDFMCWWLFCFVKTSGLQLLPTVVAALFFFFFNFFLIFRLFLLFGVIFYSV